ncbi:hypothetical protein P029_03370 [Anaplasma phagocytophilum str. Norway variant2]|uniref:Uncharacterized protein n=1 Tax=Anaplasma phagocytophilum str. Norway variant2 TaxID=1392507 RepID=A0A168HDC3_ANAPH|nr:hypothetical protein P029_03370 [Anaplasma phagocytophilum str. Norway variant2]
MYLIGSDKAKISARYFIPAEILQGPKSLHAKLLAGLLAAVPVCLGMRKHKNRTTCAERF